MQAKCTEKKTFQLTEIGEKLGQLTYENLFSYNAKIILANSDLYEINPVGFFG